MARSEFRVRMVGPISIVEVRGVLDEAAAQSLLEFVAAASTACQAVRVHLDTVDRMTPEATALLIRADGQPGRQAVLWAYAQRRAQAQTA
jgi:hypothetical protein